MSERRVALVTGGAKGIGAACCRALAAEDFRVVVHHRSSGAAAEELVAKLPDAVSAQADLADPESIDALVKRLKSDVGRIDVLVNNAGMNVNAPMATMKLDDYDAVTAVARGTWYLTKNVVRRFMLRQDGGRIIQISSVVGHTGNPGQVPYTMVKAGLDAMTKSLAQEVGARGILVNAVAPGFIETDMTAELPPEIREGILARVPLGRMGSPEDVAEAVRWLAVSAPYVQGTVLHVNGGLHG